MTLLVRFVTAAAIVVLALPGRTSAQSTPRQPLAPADIDAIARLEMIEDRRHVDTLDTAELKRLLGAAHPEVRRRAAVTVGRLANTRGIPLLLAQPLDRDSAVTASVVWAVGQIRDSSTVHWLDSVLTSPRTMPTVRAEAAIALGKIKGGDTRDVLARFLSTAIATSRTQAAIGQALLSIGRAAGRGRLTSIVKWATSPNEEIRWSATWALARLRDPAGVVTLLTLAGDRSALVRSWAIRGLARPIADSAALAGPAEAALMRAVSDADRTVRTEAIRALRTYSDSAAIAKLVEALRSPDSWIAVSAAEGLGAIRAVETVNPLVAATASGQPCALRLTARQSLQAFAQDTTRPGLQAVSREAAMAALIDIARDTVPYCQTTAVTALRRLTNLPAAGSTMRTTIDSILAASPAPAQQPRPAPAPLTRTLADYRAIVERWVVPEYQGKARPRAEWETPRGKIELELYPGDAPLAVDDFVRRTESGGIVGTQFTRVVPDFVDQQETIRGGVRLRDEVNRLGLTRGNLAWATSGLDTGNPGYTLGHTPQPHNEGDFTSMGRVIRGMDVADRIELGDRVTAARMLAGGTP